MKIIKSVLGLTMAVSVTSCATRPPTPMYVEPEQFSGSVSFLATNWMLEKRLELEGKEKNKNTVQKTKRALFTRDNSEYRVKVFQKHDTCDEPAQVNIQSLKPVLFGEGMHEVKRLKLPMGDMATLSISGSGCFNIITFPVEKNGNYSITHFNDLKTCEVSVINDNTQKLVKLFDRKYSNKCSADDLDESKAVDVSKDKSVYFGG
ncbi:hypothetical protein CS022_03765 [Veronia nyctiphanis]|uniref:Lipoprotein n=1 Tax=Veronia nyctiphanis TaxID=1278244 RepID=A0A4Q0YSI9_9GAMM|nr:hypothetical protein [Veronia nyctiphanis]RXJ74200.1 hypothetical protein CS022_03765 [Veronia nyctiphanis]